MTYPDESDLGFLCAEHHRCLLFLRVGLFHHGACAGIGKPQDVGTEVRTSYCSTCSLWPTARDPRVDRDVPKDCHIDGRLHTDDSPRSRQVGRAGGVVLDVAYFRTPALEPRTDRSPPSVDPHLGDGQSVDAERTVHTNASFDPIFQVYLQGVEEPGECFACHTMGYNAITGQFMLAGVTCEACHGPYREGHPEESMVIATSEDLCGICDPAFHADVRGEAFWDMAILWTLPVAGMLLVVNSPLWAYFGLVGGGTYLFPNSCF